MFLITDSERIFLISFLQKNFAEEEGKQSPAIWFLFEVSHY